MGRELRPGPRDRHDVAGANPQRHLGVWNLIDEANAPGGNPHALRLLLVRRHQVHRATDANEPRAMGPRRHGPHEVDDPFLHSHGFESADVADDRFTRGQSEPAPAILPARQALEEAEIDAVRLDHDLLTRDAHVAE